VLFEDTLMRCCTARARRRDNELYNTWSSDLSERQFDARSSELI
jgi:hypothetical protein